MDVADRIYKEILSENTNVWFYTDATITKIIVKLPLDVIKSIVKGCKVEFIVGKDLIHPNKYFHAGVRIHDDPVNFITVSSTLRFADEHESLSQVFKQERVRIDFYTELNYCAASAVAEFSEPDRKKVMRFQETDAPFYFGDFDSLLTSSLNCFDYSIDKTRLFDNIYEIETLKVEARFSEWHSANVHFVGLNEGNLIVIDDKDEGGVLEKQVWAALESIFHFDLHKNPVIKKENKEREFVDVLAYYHLGILLIESKALGIFASEIDKPMIKKVATLQKHIKKGIKQLVGAKRSLDKGIEIYDNNNRLVEFDKTLVPHCVVLVSELLPFGDWTEIQGKINEASKKNKIYLHVLGLMEFTVLLKGCQGRKEYLDYFLMHRFEKYIEHKSLFLEYSFHT
ncbi:MAG: hypothetical protein ACXVP0_11315 [Bacteroidia bacterium]